MIVIPMAGRSQRFFDAGYDRPKYMLDLHGRSVFAHAVGSFERVFKHESFLFVVGPEAAAEDFVRAECARLGVVDVSVARLERTTAGQAETVEIGLRTAGVSADPALSIFNIDTFRPGFADPPAMSGLDGWLEVFRGEGANWSYVATGGRARASGAGDGGKSGRSPTSAAQASTTSHAPRISPGRWSRSGPRLRPRNSTSRRSTIT